MKIGYKASAEQFAPRPLVEYAVLAEEAGFDSVAISDHFQPWRHNDGHSPFSLSWLAAVGERTKRIELGTSVLTPHFRYNPGVVAQAFATLGCLYPGRVWLGVGTGESLNETPLGVEWPGQKERFARLKEACLLIRELWSGERVTFTGDYYRTERATIYDRPVEPIPLHIAASGPAAARLAGRIADGFICTSGKGMPLYTDVLLPAVDEGLEKAGRPSSAVERIIELKVSFDPSLERAKADTMEWAALALSPEEKMGVEDPIEMERRAGALPVDRTASRWIVSDDPAEHVERILEYARLGFDHLIFHAPGRDQERFLRLYAEHVIPRLRDIG
ncbi:glucose-6-phosphate dehydrogenase (coenzyme-F420) [Microbacterium soli]|uniref:Glucose-6-phosphate dehydrogenase (Coenzyme-F420) n=1 Tax=Microbacterium soli TaxID=446075 RepID=A0ABP7MX28_9MICO